MQATTICNLHVQNAFDRRAHNSDRGSTNLPDTEWHHGQILALISYFPIKQEHQGLIY